MKKIIKNQCGFVQIPLLVIAVVSTIVFSGLGYSVNQYNKTSKILDEAKQLQEEEKYDEAIEKFGLAQVSWSVEKLGIKKDEIEIKIEKNKKLLQDKNKYEEVVNSENLSQSISLLSDISENSFYYLKTQNKIEELKNRIEESDLQKQTEAESQRLADLDEEVREYLVRPGDSLSSISVKFNVSVDAIVWANNIKSYIIQPGDKLIILPVSGVMHLVESGDTVQVIDEAEQARLEAEAESQRLAEEKQARLEAEAETQRLASIEQAKLEGTSVGGIISEDTVWTSKNSPYIVEENIFIDENITLEVEPGVEIRFDIGKYIQVMGDLKAFGTKENFIKFTANHENLCQPWEIKVGKYREGGKGGNLKISYCEINYGTIGTESYAHGDFNNLMIDDCIFNVSSILTEGPGTSSYIRHNTFLNATNNAIRINTGKFNSVDISYNNFKENKVAIYVAAVSPTGAQISHNNFYLDNGVALDIATKDDVAVPNNWWGTTDISVIDSKILDFYDSFSLGKVDYQSIVASEISNAGVR